MPHLEFARWMRSRMQPWMLLRARERAWSWLKLDQLSAEAANDERRHSAIPISSSRCSLYSIASTDRRAQT